MKISMKCGLLLSVLYLLCTCCQAGGPVIEENSQTLNTESKDDQKVLIVYLSRTKNTKAVADIIHKYVGGDLVALELITPYPEHYQTTVDQVADENSRGFLPPLKTKFTNIDEYDVIFIGFPTWGMQLPPPMKSFLSEYDLSGKTIVPFNTNAGYGIGSSFDTVKQLSPDSEVLEGFSTRGGKEKEEVFLVIDGEQKTVVQSEVHEWLQKIGLLD